MKDSREQVQQEKTKDERMVVVGDRELAKFIWLGTRQQLAKLDMVALAADFPHFIFSLLSVTLV